MHSESKKNMALVMTMTVTAYLAASMVIVTPEKMSFIQGIVFSSSFKSMLSDPRMSIGGLYSFMGTLNFISAAAIAILYYKNHTRHLKIIIALSAIAASIKWAIEYFSFTGMLGQGNTDYSIKYYVIITFTVALLILLGLFIEEEESTETSST